MDYYLLLVLYHFLKNKCVSNLNKLIQNIFFDLLSKHKFEKFIISHTRDSHLKFFKFQKIKQRKFDSILKSSTKLF